MTTQHSHPSSVSAKETQPQLPPDAQLYQLGLVLMVWDYFAANASEARLFDDAMTAFSAAVIPAVLATYDFSGINTLVDVAGGHGFVLTSILEKYPQMRGVLFDMERVCVGARER